MQDLKVSLIQSILHWQDWKMNHRHFEQCFSKIGGTTDLILLPEMFNSGFSMEVEALAQSMDGPTVNWLKSQSKKCSAVISGTLIIKEGSNFYNRLIWVHPNGEIQHYDKRHLFRMAGEEKVFSAGKEAKVFELKGWKVCPQICYDLRFPVWNRNTDNRYDVIFFLANWPSARKLHWRALLASRAIENLSYAIGLNRTGIDGKGFEYPGDSTVFDPKGRQLIDWNEKEWVKTVILSKEELALTRRQFQFWKDADKFDLEV